MSTGEAMKLKDLIKKQRERAPGYLRARIDALIPNLTSRADRSDWRALQDRIILKDLAPRCGQMTFPVIMTENIPGALVTARVLSTLGSESPLETASRKRVAAWLTRTLSDLLQLEPSQIELRLAYLLVTWRLGCEQTPMGDAEFPTELAGHSMDLAIALALIGYLLSRVPHGPWVVSGALGEPGQLAIVGHCVEKRRVIAEEAPDLSPDRNVLVERAIPFGPVLKRVYGEDVIAALADAFGQSATALLDEANAAWCGRDEKRAASLARSALSLTTNPSQEARARLILAADAVHRGALTEATSHFEALETAGSRATLDEGWFHNDMREAAIRMAGADLDRLAPEAARHLVEPVIAALNATPSEYRTARWHDLMAQAEGTLSRVLLAEGQLPQAIAKRREALTHGPDQERARSRLELATLLLRQGDHDEGHAMLEWARRDLSLLPEGPARQQTAGFIRIAQIVWGVLIPGRFEADTATFGLHTWPKPAETIAVLLAVGAETDALSWFERHVFGEPAPSHPAFADFLVTACARAVARGFESTRWREGAAHIVTALELTSADPRRVKLLRAFVAGGDTQAVIEGCLY